MCVQLMLLVCLHHVCASVHCLVGVLVLPPSLDLLRHPRVLVDRFVGLGDHLDLGCVALCHYIAPLRLLLWHGVGCLAVVQGGRLGHDHVGGALLQHTMEAARHGDTLHAHALLGGARVHVHVLLEEHHPLLALLLLRVLLQLLLGGLGVLLGVLLSPLRVPPLALLLSGCNGQLLPLVLVGSHCCHMLLLLLGGGEVLLVGRVPFPHPPGLVHLHSLLGLYAGHVDTALLPSHVMHVILLVGADTG